MKHTIIALCLMTLPIDSANAEAGPARLELNCTGKTLLSTSINLDEQKSAPPPITRFYFVGTRLADASGNKTFTILFGGGRSRLPHERLAGLNRICFATIVRSAVVGSAIGLSSEGCNLVVPNGKEFHVGIQTDLTGNGSVEDCALRMFIPPS